MLGGVMVKETLPVRSWTRYLRLIFGLIVNSRRMRHPVVLFAFIMFVTIVYAIMVLGQPTNMTMNATATLDLYAKMFEKLSLNGTMTTAALGETLNVTNLTSYYILPPSISVNDVDDSVFYHINKPDKCQGAGTVDLLAMVVTGPNNSEIRSAIRHTWGTVGMRSNVRLVFVLGRPEHDDVQEKLVREDAVYNDIVQGNFYDAYYNLTLKSVMILKWAHTYCKQARFVLKIDDDCFLNPYNLLAFLDSKKDKQDPAVFGRVWQKVKPIRDKKDKWSISHEAFPGKEFPDYVGGPSYVITQKAVGPLLKASGRVKRLDLEDVYVTGLCAEFANVPRINDNRFNSADPPHVCASRDVITYHRIVPDLLYMLWWTINDQKFAACGSKDKGCPTTQGKLLIDLTNTVLTHLHI